jgi:hypothetical protein
VFDLLFLLSLQAEALAGMPHRKVVHPTAYYRVDHLHNRIYRCIPICLHRLFPHAAAVLRLSVRREHAWHDRVHVINSRIVLARGGDQLLRLACVIGAIGGLALLTTGLSGAGGIVGLAVPLFIVLSLLTMVASNAISGALSVFPDRAGAAAALAGAIQFGAGALASAAVGWSADGTPRPMSAIICAAAIAALLVNLFLVRNAARSATKQTE